MSTPYFSQGCATPATTNNCAPRYPVGMASATEDAPFQHLPPNGSIGGLGIVCPSGPGQSGNKPTVNFQYNNSAWERQVDNQILQFQLSYEQAQHPNDSASAPFVSIHSPYLSPPAAAIGSTPGTNTFEHHGIEQSGAPTDKPPTSSRNVCLPSYITYQQFPSFPDIDPSTGHGNIPDGYLSPRYSSQQHIPLEAAARYSGQWASLSAQNTPYTSSGMFATPHLHPSAETMDRLSRRLSVSSNAPSSMVSSDFQDTPYFITPLSTPRFAPSMSMEDSYSNLSSPVHPTHSRSPSSTSLKASNSNYRPIRPAPYTLDAAQRQRWSTGKTMSLPNRRTQPPDFSFSPSHMRSVSEQNINNMYFADDFGNGDRTSFNQSLDIIRQGLPPIIPGSLENDSPEIHTIKTKTLSSSSSHRPKLAIVQPRTLAPVSVLSCPRIPPLNLPSQTRPLSPPPEDLSPTSCTAPKENNITSHDSYTPKYSRGTKGHLEGFCGLCKPGRWLNMKTSAYWYDKKFNHGINPKTKRAFELPVQRRWKNGSSVIREGLCGMCGEWALMDSCKTSWRKWWRHAYEVSCFALIEADLLTSDVE
jgi:hypothetical protein